jgi:acetoin utilization protein AcuB
MNKATPKVVEHMTPIPYSIDSDQALARAHAMMRDHQIRHLPVFARGRLVGILTDRDLHLIETLKGVNPSKVTVEEAMTASPYAVASDAPLAEVCAEMAEHKYGCAVVLQHERVIGIFTTVDACRALAEILRD